MKPSTFKTLKLLRAHEFVTTRDLLQAEGIGARYGARLYDLRQEGYVIVEERLPLPTRGSRYRLVAEPETVTPRESRRAPRLAPKEPTVLAAAPVGSQMCFEVAA